MFGFFGFRALWPKLSLIRKIGIVAMFVGLFWVIFLMMPYYVYLLAASSRHPDPAHGYVEMLPLLSGARPSYVTETQERLFYLSTLPGFAALAVFGVIVFYLVIKAKVVGHQ